MARRTSNKIQPAVMTLNLVIPSTAPGAIASETLDLSQCASLLNRRAYRQGLNWAVAGFKILSPGGALGQLRIQSLPNTWVTSNSWKKAKNAWNKQQMDAIEDAGAQSAVARFRDFKVHADGLHALAGFGNNLLPQDGSLPVPLPYATGEWESSLIILPNADIDAASGARTEPRECNMHMVGANEVALAVGSSRGIIEGYADSRAYPQSPDPVSPAIDSGNNWLRAMFDVGNDNEDITDNATDRNDNLPYPQVNYPGGQIQAPSLTNHDLIGISGTTIGGTSRGKGGNFPCGLVRFDWAVDPAASTSYGLVIQVDLVPGHHRGYLAEPMTEM
jgi:hypothetical protein